jgi:hypothetical protein
MNGRTKLIAGGVVAGGLMLTAAGLVMGAGIAHAQYGWVEDESASICNSLSLAADKYGDSSWVTLQISMLQLSQDIGRREAVAGIHQAATQYCPEYIAYTPTH